MSKHVKWAFVLLLVISGSSVLWFSLRWQSFPRIQKCSSSCWAPELEDLGLTWQLQTPSLFSTVTGWVHPKACRTVETPVSQWLLTHPVCTRIPRQTCRLRTAVTALARPNQWWSIAWWQPTPLTRRSWRGPQPRGSWSKWSSTRVSDYIHQLPQSHMQQCVPIIPSNTKLMFNNSCISVQWSFSFIPTNSRVALKAKTVSLSKNWSGGLNQQFSKLVDALSLFSIAHVFKNNNEVKLMK